MTKSFWASSCSCAVLLQRALALGLITGLALGAGAPAVAQDRPTAEGFVLAAPLRDSYLSVWGTSALRPGAFSLALSGTYGRHPLPISSGDEALGQLVGSLTTFELMGTVGLFKPVDLSVAVPLHILTHGTGFSDATIDQLPPGALLTDTKVSLGDVRVTPRLRLFEPEGDSGYGLALLVPVWLPTGDRDIYAGEKLRVEPKLAFEAVTPDLSFGLNIGYQFRGRTRLLDTKVDDMGTWGVALGLRVVEALRVIVELSGRLNLQSDDFTSGDAPTELLGALRLTSGRFLAQLGGGPGLIRGIGGPSYRLLGAIALLPAPPEPPDADHDGVLDADDKCINEPEDKDGYQDDDGCPDLDNDGDGIPDATDRCPSEAEDADGFEDQDGCPDVDNDHDEILDPQDACPGIPGPPNSTPAANGCPDRDGDGIADGQDSCPDTPGVLSSEPGKNGCPVNLDHDDDGILDKDDACPDAAGPANPDPKRNGCPKARVEAGQIKITERIEFVSGKAELAPSSTPILQAVLQVMEAHPEITHLQVEGHTDSRGEEKLNETLSRRRAESVKRWLVGKGIDAGRLDARGFGESRPIDTNDTAEGRTSNRRVEFHIQGPAGESAPVPAPNTTAPRAPSVPPSP